MAKHHYPFVAQLASRLDAVRSARGLSFAHLGKLTKIDAAQAWRICRGEFATLNPSVLKICDELGVTPERRLRSGGELDRTEAQLVAEVIAAWDRTDAGAQLLTRVLRALRHP